MLKMIEFGLIYAVLYRCRLYSTSNIMDQGRSVTSVQVMPQVITHMARDSPSQDVEYGNPPETKAVSTNLLPSEKIVKEFVGKNHWLCCIEVGGNQLTLTSERAIIKHWTQACCG